MAVELDFFATIEKRFNQTLRIFRDQHTLLVIADQVHDVLLTLRDDYQFNMLLDVTAVDYWRKQPRFHVVYQLYSMPNNLRLTVRAPLERNQPHIATASDLYPGANWYEREVWDLFGIRFDNHPDPRRIVMPADWEGHPLRKDYPLGYEEPQYTFNFEEISVRKLHPEK